MADDKQAPSIAKKPYKAPRLEIYGSVKTLTASGTSFAPPEGMAPAPLAPFTMPGSDRRLKQNIVEIGTHPLGMPLYRFEYKPEFQNTCGSGCYFGVMADEVEDILPEAVSERADGYKQVNYALLGIEQAAR